jgi:Arc/MetJ-type ribon-helix-helix transcriptional regulator
MQVRLPQEDLTALRRLSAEKGVSVSELVRRGVKQLLKSEQGPTREELWERASALAGKYHSGKPDIGQRHDDYLEEAYME